MTAPRKPILTEEEIKAEGETYTVYKPCEDNFRQGFRLGARFALAAAEKREELWRELVFVMNDWELGTEPDDERISELRAALGLEGA